ncbi:MAG: hypothetical protein MZW92_53800 [Comamonadaceae bacterium]|nr:hypothetical protein [Comamonadaceae bacterium]
MGATPAGPFLFLIGLISESPNPEPRVPSPYLQRERELDGDQHRHRLAEALARHEAPLLGGRNGFLIEAEARIQRTDDLALRHRALGGHDAVEHRGPLDLGPHRIGRVFRLHFPEQPRVFDAGARPVRTAAEAAAPPRAQA